MLLSTGRVNVDSVYIDGETSLVYAIGSHRVELVRVLLEAGADIKRALKQNDDGSLTFIRKSYRLDDLEDDLRTLWDKYARK